MSFNLVGPKHATLTLTGLASVILQIPPPYANHLTISLSEVNPEPLPEKSYQDHRGATRTPSSALGLISVSGITTHSRRPNPDPRKFTAYHPDCTLHTTALPTIFSVFLNTYYNINCKPLVNTRRPEAPFSQSYRQISPPPGYSDGPSSSGFSLSIASNLIDSPSYLSVVVILILSLPTRTSHLHLLTGEVKQSYLFPSSASPHPAPTTLASPATHGSLTFPQLSLPMKTTSLRTATESHG